MPFVPVPGAVEVRLNFTIGNAEQMVNVLHYRNVGDVDMTSAIATELADNIGGEWQVNLAAFISDEVVLQSVSVKDISAADLPTFASQQNAAGTDASEILPYGTALVTTLRTAVGSRGGRGRIYLGGFCEDSNGGGDAANVGAVAAADAFIDGIDSWVNLAGDPLADFVLGVVSRFAHVGGDPNGAPIAPVIRDVVSHNTNRRWDTQRRRSNKIRI